MGYCHRIVPVVFGAAVFVAGCSPVVLPDTGGDGQEAGGALRADPSRSDIIVVADRDQIARVTLDGTASTNGGETITQYEWRRGQELLGTGAVVVATFSIGRHDLTLAVSDGAGGVDMAAFTLTVLANESAFFNVVIAVSGQGETVPPAGVTEHPSGETIRIQALAAEGFRFVRWSGDITAGEASVVLVVDRDLFITAEFLPTGPDVVPRFFLPWAAGQEWQIGQGNDGGFSHEGRFAWDISLPEGTPILATAAGRVVEVVDTSLRDDALVIEIGETANFVTIDHGRGLQSLYAHLDFGGVTVVPGQLVAAGQVIGFSGNTGFSTAPHLHYEVLDTEFESVPSAFFEVAEHNGVPVEGDRVTSQNALLIDSVEDFVPSRLAPDAFAVNNIRLTGDLPPAFFYVNETDYVVTGRVLDGATRVCVALVDPETFDTVVCDLTDTEDDGTFVHRFRLPRQIAGPHFMGVISGTSGAEGSAPRSIVVLPFDEEQSRPVAVIADPGDGLIDFFQTRYLSSVGSVSPLGRSLNYRWMQVSGPPAVVRDPTAPQTEFYLRAGAGIERVAFQLVVDDGRVHSFPDEVAFQMPDTLFVNVIGIADEVCVSLDTCPALELPFPAVSLSTQVIQGWVELVNVEVGDALVFRLIDPNGGVVRLSEVVVTEAPSPVSFWRFVWSSIGLELILGDWTASFERDGVVEAALPFRVIP